MLAYHVEGHEEFLNNTASFRVKNLSNIYADLSSNPPPEDHTPFTIASFSQQNNILGIERCGYTSYQFICDKTDLETARYSFNDLISTTCQQLGDEETAQLIGVVPLEASREDYYLPSTSVTTNSPSDS